jgi:RHS repeat-associated protein
VGILALLLCWVPGLGQALLILAAIVGIIAALSTVYLAARGERSWMEALLSVVGAVLGCIGLRAAVTGLKAGMAAFKLAKAASGGFKNALMAVVKQGGKKALDSVKIAATKIKEFVKCKILRRDPIDIRDGSVFVEQIDFEVPGRLPLVWERNYSSGDSRVGVCGYGWDTLADIRLELAVDGWVSFLGPWRGAAFPHLPSGDDGYVLDRFDGARLLSGDGHWQVHTKDGLRYIFSFSPDVSDGELVNAGVLSLVERIEDASGNSWRFERCDGRLIRIVESGLAGRVLEVESSNEDLVRSLTLIDPSSGDSRLLVAYRYDDGDLVGVVDALGAEYGFAYQEHRMVRHTDRLGLSFNYKYDKQWRVVHTWGDGGLFEGHFAYDEALHQTTIVDSLGYATVVTFDEDDLPIREVDPLGGVTVYKYDPDSWRTVAVTAPGDLLTTYEYDEHGNSLSTTLPDGSIIRTIYNHGNRPLVVTDPEGGQWAHEWDEHGNITRQTTPSGASTNYEYTDQGDLRSVTDPAGQRTILEYDSLGFLSGMTDVLGQRTEFAHDTFGNLLVEKLANGDTTQYRYDGKNRLVVSVMPDGKHISCSYDAEDYLTRHLDEAGRETRFAYNSQGKLKSRVDPDGSSVEYHYDTEEQLVGVSNQKGQRWYLNRDAVGRLIEEIDYWGQARHYNYDPAGHLIRSTDPLGQVLAITCDNLGRITSVQASGVEAETRQYNRLGQLTQAVNRWGTTSRKYNEDAQLSGDTQQHADVVAGIDYVYDLAGRRVEQVKQFRGPRGVWFKQTERYTYNALGQPESVQIDDHELISFTYDAIGRLTRQGLGENLTQHFRYNATGRIALQASQLKGQLQTQIDYEYDSAGNLTSRDDHLLGADQYRYDLLGQITAQTDPTGKVRQFIYSPTGDRFKISQEDERGQMLQHDDGSTWRLDKSGQVVHKKDALGNSAHLKWDAFGRLCAYLTDGDAGEYNYAYDPLGRRVRKTKSDPHGLAPEETTWFIWNADVLVGEVKQTESEPQQAQFYSYHQDSSVPLAMQTQTPEEQSTRKALYVYQNDPNGMPLRLQDENCEIVWEAAYTAHGQVDSLDASLNQPLRLQGQYFDDESGLHYNRYRYYDPGAGCFISQDPIRLQGGFNPYQFALNVFSWIDALGLQCHHIATNKHSVYSPQFRDLFNKYGLGRFKNGRPRRDVLNDPLNKVYVPGHKGPHTDEMHQAILKRLTTAGAMGESSGGLAMGKAFVEAELSALRQEAVTAGSWLNNILIKAV